MKRKAICGWLSIYNKLNERKTTLVNISVQMYIENVITYVTYVTSIMLHISYLLI